MKTHIHGERGRTGCGRRIGVEVPAKRVTSRPSEITCLRCESWWIKHQREPALRRWNRRS